jgi:hypothetical protein
MTPLDGSRKCYRLVGGVLVERTVADVLPALKGQRTKVRLDMHHEASDACEFDDCAPRLGLAVTQGGCMLALMLNFGWDGVGASLAGVCQRTKDRDTNLILAKHATAPGRRILP